MIDSERSKRAVDDSTTPPGRDDPDVFTEYAPFEETDKYAKSILQYWWIKRYIWVGS
jgi:hypothetical protein